MKPQPPPPIYIASLSPKTLTAAPSLGEGAILSPALSTARETAAKVGWVQKGLGGKAGFDIASYMLTSVADNPVDAEKAVRAFYFFIYQVSEVIPASVLEPYGVNEEQLAPVKEAWKRGNIPEAGSKIPSEAVDALTVTGTRSHCLERLEEYRGAGVSLPIVMPIGDVGKAIVSLAPTA